MRFARYVFFISGVTGALIIGACYFLESRVVEGQSPINHPEFYYGFLGVTLAWQILFLLIAADPVRYRPVMLPAILEKASWCIAIPILYTLERVDAMWLGSAAMDGTWLILFAIAYVKTPGAE